MLRQLGALFGMLKQRLETKGERINEIVGATILPASTTLPPASHFHASSKALVIARRGRTPRTLSGQPWPMLLPT
jgi:hypothetical protein